MRIASAIAGVYCLLSSEGRAYFGSSGNIPRRVRGHKTLLEQGRHPNLLLQADWDRLGDTGFESHVVAVVADAKRREDLERDLIRAQEPSMVYNRAHRGKSTLIPPPSEITASYKDLGKLVNISTYARLAGISRKTVHNWLKAGTAPRHVLVCGNVYFYRPGCQ